LQPKKIKSHIAKSILNYIDIISCIDTRNTKKESREDNFSALLLCHPNVFDRGYCPIFIE
jgi:hypothetical protein